MEYQAKLQEGKLQDIATYQFFYFLLSYTSFYISRYFVNFSELIRNYQEKDFCHKNAVKTSPTPTLSTANCSAW